MDRRESLKKMFIGGVASSVMLSSCVQEKEKPIEKGDIIEEAPGYGRTPAEASRDEALRSEKFFNDEEMATITVLSDIIIPEDEDSVSASATGVPSFIEFMVKDIPALQLPLRGGLMWLNRESHKRFDKGFIDISEAQQIEIIDTIAYPEDHLKNSPGPVFFEEFKKLVITGFFTSKEGIDYLDYQGNRPNIWDGIPEEVLQKHGMQYDEKLLKVAMDPNTRHEVMNWDDYLL